MTLPKTSPKKLQTIVSVTPLRVQTDSRTFKQAASVARFGYVSVAVEGYKSDFVTEFLPFHLHTIARSDTSQQARAPAETCAEGGARRWSARHVWQQGKNVTASLLQRLPEPLQV